MRSKKTYFFPTLHLWPVLAFLSSACGDHSINRPLPRDTAGIQNAILQEVPLGTPEDKAEIIMRRWGFTVERKIDSEFSGMQGMADFFHCNRVRASGFAVSRRIQVALVVSNEKVCAVYASTGLTGP